MLANRSSELSRYFDFRLGLGVSVVLMALLLLLDPSGVDFAIEQLFYQPGGHASSGFSLLALFFLLRDKRPRSARAALLFALGLGAAFSLGRMMQGAHFLSHNLWTLLLDWTICLLCYRWILYRAPLAQPAGQLVLKPQEG